MEKALAVVDQNKSLEVFGSEFEHGAEVAAFLKVSMDRKKKKILFNGKEYAEIHDLQVISNFFGHSISTPSAVPVEINGIKGFKAHAEMVNKSGICIAQAEAYCMADEPNWARKPMYQLASMAQTRAAGKCITNNYRWVLDLAGYGTASADEMPVETSPGKPWPHPADVSQEESKPGLLTATILLTELKDFVSKKGTVFYRIIDEKTNGYLLFDKPLIEMAKTLIGQEVSISYEKSKYGSTIKDLNPL